MTLMNLTTRFTKYFGRRTPLMILIGLPIAIGCAVVSKFVDIRLIEIPNRFGHAISSLDFWITFNRRNHILKCSRNRCKLIFFLDDKFLEKETIELISSLVPLNSYWLWGRGNEVIHFLGLQDRLTLDLVDGRIDDREQKFKGTESPIVISRKSSFYRKYNVLNQFLEGRKGLVLLCIRDSGYGSSIGMKSAEEIAEYRNSNFNNYLGAIDVLTQRGYSVVRMGMKNSVIPDSKIPDFYEYSYLKTKYSLEQIDLFSNCSFVISSDTGLNKMAVLCRKPLYMLNMGAFTDRFLHGLTPLVMYKKFYDIGSNKELKLEDLISKLAYTFTDSKDFQKSRIHLEENSYLQIRLFAKESLEVYESKWIQSSGSKRITKKFRDTLGTENWNMGDFQFPNFYAENWDL